MNKMPYIVMYHSVAWRSDPAADPFHVTVSRRRLEAQLGWMTRCGLRGVSVGELLAAHDRRGLVGLTFDDGYADFLDYAVPALLRRGFTATAFVVAGRIGTCNGWESGGPVKPLMDADAVRACADAGIEIGSHGMRHVHLSELSRMEAFHEIADSRELLGDLLRAPVAGYCYAYGDHDAYAAERVHISGYDYACAVGPSPCAGQYALPRTYIGEADTAPRLLAKRVRSAAAGWRR